MIMGLDMTLGNHRQRIDDGSVCAARAERLARALSKIETAASHAATHLTADLIVCNFSNPHSWIRGFLP
jgi:hypothetical protein